MTHEIKNKAPQNIKKRIGWFIVLASILTIFILRDLSPEVLAEYIQSFGVYAVLIFIALYAIAVCIPFGTTIMSIAAGIVFGALHGSLITLACAATLSFIPFYISRLVLHNWIYTQAQKSPKMQKIINTINDKSGALLFYIRLIPTIPFEVQNYAAGLTKIAPRTFFLATLFGIMPVIIILNFFGNALQDIGSTQFFIVLVILIVFMSGPPLYYWIHTKLKKS